jgi:hypothetical protein
MGARRPGATLADNLAGAYAVAAIYYGAHPPARMIRSWAGMPPSIWPAEYAIVLAVAQASNASPPTFPAGSVLLSGPAEFDAPVRQCRG